MKALVGILLILSGTSLLFPSAGALNKAPQVSLLDVDGVQVNITGDYEGQVILLDFMHLQCSPCKDLAHDLKTLYDRDYEDFELISIDINPSWDSPGDVKEYADGNGYDWRFVMDTDDGEATEKYNAVPVPKLVIIDREGYVTYEKTGTVSLEKLTKQVEAALAGTAERTEIVQLGLAMFALVAALGCYFSPCAFPLLPGYIAYYFKVGADKRQQEAEAEEEGGSNPGGPRRPSRSKLVATGFKLGSISGAGIVMVYGLLGLIFIPIVLGISATELNLAYLEPIVGVILIVLGGLVLADITPNFSVVTSPFKRAWRRLRPPKGGPRKPSFNVAGLFLYGVGYGSASASCSAPIFLALMARSVKDGQVSDLLVALVIFLASLWILMAVVTVALTLSEERVKVGLMKHYVRIKQAVGLVFIVVGAALLWLFLSGEGYI